MDLRERLRLLKAAGRGAGRGESRAGANPDEAVLSDVIEAFSPPIGGGLRRAEPDGARLRPAVPLGELSADSPRSVILGGCLDGYEAATPDGPAFYVETRYPLEYQRGPLPLEHLFQVPGASWELLARVPRSVDLRRALFLDTETTGLAGGTGTYAFLIGIGFFDGFNFVVRQYFLRDYGEEEAILSALESEMGRFSLLVSFNGKSFDWPLLETRFRLSRRPVPMRGAPHLDLLHPARRLFKERLGACNLTALEAQILNVHRQGDVPGHLIPQLYFDYLRSGRVDPLIDVIMHNRWDIVTLVSLAGWLGQMVTAPLDPTPDGELLCGDDLFALGRLFEARGELGLGLTCLETARERGLRAIAESRALRQLSQVYKRVREHERAVAIWQGMLTGGGGLSLFPYVELAKYYEHVARDLPAAREVAAQALTIAEQRRSLAGVYGPAALREQQELQHRLARLERKLQA